MIKTWLGLFAVSVVVGCSSSGPSAEAPPAAPSGESPEETEDPDAEGDGGGEGAPRVGVRYHYAYDAPFKTTAAACADSSYWGDTCGACGGGPASPGVAAVYVSGNDTPSSVKECDAVPSSSAGTVSTVAYCCETPFINVLGPAAAPKSCDDVCAAEGLVCTEEAPFYDGLGGSVAPGAVILAYSGGAKTGSRVILASCAVVPATTKTIKGKSESLQEYVCGCVDARSTIPSPP